MTFKHLLGFPYQHQGDICWAHPSLTNCGPKTIGPKTGFIARQKRGRNDLRLEELVLGLGEPNGRENPEPAASHTARAARAGPAAGAGELPVWT